MNLLSPVVTNLFLVARKKPVLVPVSNHNCGFIRTSGFKQTNLLFLKVFLFILCLLAVFLKITNNLSWLLKYHLHNQLHYVGFQGILYKLGVLMYLEKNISCSVCPLLYQPIVMMMHFSLLWLFHFIFKSYFLMCHNECKIKACSYKTYHGFMLFIYLPYKNTWNTCYQYPLFVFNMTELKTTKPVF